MPTPAGSGFRHGWSTMPKLRVGMPPMILAVMASGGKSVTSLYNIFKMAIQAENILFPNWCGFILRQVVNLCV